MDSAGGGFGGGGRKEDFDEDDDENSSGRQSPSGADSTGRGQGDEKKPKKPKNGKQPEYLCRNCGRNDSPEWRKVGCVGAGGCVALPTEIAPIPQGPLGAKTLCNACGLRWAKRNAGPTPKKPKDGKPKEKGEGASEHKQEDVARSGMAPPGHLGGGT